MANPQKTYSTLIRLSEQRLEELRNNIGVFLDRRDTLVQENASLEQELVLERASFGDAPELQFAFANFETNVRIKQENNDKFMAHIDGEVEKLREKTRAEFAESKKYEKLLELHQEREVKKAERVEAALADERNLNRYQAVQGEV